MNGSLVSVKSSQILNSMVVTTASKDEFPLGEFVRAKRNEN